MSPSYVLFGPCQIVPVFVAADNLSNHCGVTTILIAVTAALVLSRHLYYIWALSSSCQGSALISSCSLVA